MRMYYYVNLKMTWTNAQQYCREKYTDLATFESMDDISRLNSTFTYSWAWIGLEDDPKSWMKIMANNSNSWRWSTTGETSKTTFNIWHPSNPDSTDGNETCVAMTEGKWYDLNCDTEKFFMCYEVTGQNTKRYVYIKTAATWSRAQTYCRSNFTDLAMIENTAENTAASAVMPAIDEAWIGLYRVPWTWSDKSSSTFRNWRLNSPNNYMGNQYCMTEISKRRTTVRMTTLTAADLTDPATSSLFLQQLNAMLRAQGWTDLNLQWKIQPKKRQEGGMGLNTRACTRTALLCVSEMDQILSVIVLFFGFCIPSSDQLRRFHYVNMKMTWKDAQSYCREKYLDLAIITSMEHIGALNRPPLDTGGAWIGLKDDPAAWKGTMGSAGNSWRWSATGQTSKTGYQKWSLGEPNNKYVEYCGLMSLYGQWTDYSCEHLTKFVCYNETEPQVKTYVLISTELTWSDAQAYCRTHYTDLPTIESSEDNNNVNSIRGSETVWTGLHRVPWTWSDNSNSLFRNWAPGEPNNADLTQYCAKEVDEHKWDDSGCSNKNAFICYQEENYITVVRITVHTDADMKDSALSSQILQQLGALLTRLQPANIKLGWKMQPNLKEHSHYAG
ncbi:macrophage mannose receptor 1-like [Parambassis ranga]|uniref:Macrophage mannose receptor 1-like n=1 Tax=Parambassis ranga TaxID=210632 RepID=A0A6P7JW44_9TELE|nr:macrophage mannose receptor 1-like [Parambassis ranga]